MTKCAVPIAGQVQDYDWGVVNGLSEFTGQTTGGPEAELWFGAHPNKPSTLIEADGSLADVLHAQDVPLLVKILAAETPLSLQVHPSAKLAQKWRRDDKSHDLLSDDVAKAEMLIALDPFLVLVGWRPVEQAADILEKVGVHERIVHSLRKGDRQKVIKHLFDGGSVSASPGEWERAAGSADESAPAAMAAIANKFGDDPGVCVAALLQSHELAPGDGVYLPTGVPHAYVHGRGLEVMTSSDNVLRMGLTSKQVALDYSLAALDDDYAPEHFVAPEDGQYAPNEGPFRLQIVQQDTLDLPTDCYRLVLPLSGGTQAGEKLVEMGQALVFPANCPSQEISVSGRAAVICSTSV